MKKLEIIVSFYIISILIINTKKTRGVFYGEERKNKILNYWYDCYGSI